MKTFIVELNYGRELRIKADKCEKEGDRHVFYTDAGACVDNVLCEIVSAIRAEGEPTVTPSSTDGPRDLNELIETLTDLRNKIQTSNSEAFQLAKRVVPEHGRVLFERLGITDTLLIVGFGEGLKSAAYSIKNGNQASALRLVDQAIKVLTLYKLKTQS
jgi:hypothetical protein